ncbi:hypothetical protein NLX67_15030 [Domibacillus sp. A3M-37]|uniref:hypothetical protein n=1 Tax=Domibacillus sp. A3M-37 TaxID=2962037 RepID=UPI0020B76586|nr:hypothetical protein [Domibacillus sp. A3M-37]MCP3763688.1 hypothetical protein [Domibacillus sp. A3M-37]
MIDEKLQELGTLINQYETKELKPKEKQGKKKPMWDQVLSSATATAETSYSAAAINYRVLAVDRFYQRLSGVQFKNTACGPTSGAMIFDYYYDVKGYNVRDNAYFGGDANTSVARLINHLTVEMNTSGTIGTYMSDWINGMYTHTRETTSAFSRVTVSNLDSDSYGNSLKYRSAINNDNPAGLRFDRFSSFESDGIEWHFLAGIGYDLSGIYAENLQVYYLDPDGSDSSVKKFDWSANDQDFVFAHLTR